MGRYIRQKELVDQEKLKSATVLIGGVGGLGSFASLYLALAGVETLIIVDRDRVEESNLNRQLLYHSSDIGRYKVEVAAERLREVNEDVRVIPVKAVIDETFRAPRSFDVVIDGMDNIEGRYALEEIAMRENVPYIFGAVEGYMGMVTFIDSTTRRLKDFFHARDKKGTQVLGAAAGMVASIQALEALKYLSGRGDLLKNRLLIYDALSTNFLEVKL